jgi:hypothetical protein
MTVNHSSGQLVRCTRNEFRRCEPGQPIERVLVPKSLAATGTDSQNVLSHADP